MPSYKLTYFDARSRGEISRMLFTAAGKEFEDVRINFEDWPKHKADTPQGTVPMLEVDGGRKISQSMTLARYLAREFNLYGKNNEEMCVVDEILDTCVDTYGLLVSAMFADESIKEKKMETYKNDLPKYLGFLEELVKTSGKNGFAVGDSLTAADLALHVYIENAEAKDQLDKFPRLMENRKNTENLPRIKTYLEKRPVSKY